MSGDKPERNNQVNSLALGSHNSNSAASSPYPPVPFQTFDWDAYLKETNSFAAPPEYFKQVNILIFYCYSIVISIVL